MPSGFFRENGGSSFTEVVRNVHSMKEVSESKMYQKVEVMYWDGEGNDTRWLEYSVVGVLKTFTDVSLVVKTLLDSQRLDWAVGEPLMIAEDTLNRDNLYSGKVLVLIPFNHKCPDFIKVQSGRRAFSVSVWEDPTQISYSNILQWLGLDWDDHDGQLSPGSEKSKEDTGGGGKVEGGEMGCNNLAHQNNHLGKDDRQTDYRSKRTVGDMGLGEAELFGIGKEKNINGVFKSNKSKGKEVGRSQVFKEAVMMGSKPGGGVISSSEETESGRVVISPKYRGDSSKGGLGHVVGGNIVIDLGCGLIDEGNNGLSKALALKVLNKPNQSDVRLLKRAHFELELDGFSKAQEEENCSSSGF
ncbi:hypothetical protein LWI29_006479 [Acer saccharum]|uniref:Uncharacterized protein n=1 Tax=Acer saccharum TaxID=4024 RepID=A0AA39SQ17_ACESA|nr:hypothetical protein LWI29_006479 [Acer saccharum]